MSIAKENAATAALEFVKDGMVLGLGSGSTAEIFLDRLGDRIAGGLKVAGVPTSQRTAHVAREAGVPLLDPDRVERIESNLQSWPTLALAGNGYRGVGIPVCVRSGIDAATKVAQACSK